MLVRQLVMNAAAGCFATAPMTATMGALFRRLPQTQQYPLPPRLITERLARVIRVRQRLAPEDRTALTWINHYAYGAAAGAAYTPIARMGAARLPAPLLGSAWGLIVWSGSYLGLLPSLGLMPSATRQPPQRNLLMIAAHLVWGATLGVLAAGKHGDRDEATM